MLLFQGQPLDDDAQIAFSRRFGSLEVTRSINPAAGTPFARQSNLDIQTGEVILPDDRRMIYQLANMLWHSDSSFKAVPSLCSLLSARILPPEGGATEFASTRCAYPSLPEALKRRVETAIAVYDFSWSRDQVRPGFFTEKERAEFPPVRHPVVRTNPVNGRKSLFLGAHASYIVGLPLEAGRALLKELLAHVSQPQFCYRHDWKEGDLVVWDNRCVLHRATPYDTVTVPARGALARDRPRSDRGGFVSGRIAGAVRRGDGCDRLSRGVCGPADARRRWPRPDRGALPANPGTSCARGAGAPAPGAAR